MKFVFIAFGLFGCGVCLTGCATPSVQTDALLNRKTALPLAAKTGGVPFLEQSAGHCGPATLAMALQFAGKNISIETISPQVYTPGVRGTFQSDMISASRRQGMVAIPIAGIENLLAEVAGGHPVIVFENLALTWLPQWHYAIVFGYDLKKPEVVMHSGPEAEKHWDLRKFERSWMLADYWGLVVLNPGQLSASAGEFDHVKATAALENIGKEEEAKKSYQRILEKWPDSLGAAIGSANIAYAQGASAQAVEFLELATRRHPDSAIAWHNLTIAYGAEQKIKQARQSALQALKWAAPEERSTYSENLKAWL